MTMPQVALIVSPTSVEQISKLAHEMPVWMSESLISGDALAEMRATSPFTVTTFSVSAGERAGDTVNRMVGDLDEHHCEVPQQPRYQTLRVVGARLDDVPLSSLRDLGFVRFDQTSEGFLAFKDT